MSVLGLDWLLASLHHLVALALIAVLFAEWIWTSQDLDSGRLRTLARLDLAYGVLAAVMLAAGCARLAWGAKAPGFYLGQPLFWAKLGAFLVIGLLSVLPTLAILKWRRRGESVGRTSRTLRRVRRVLLAEGLLALTLPVLAAGMARGFGS